VGLSQLITLGDRAQHISDAAARAGLPGLHVKDAAEAAAAVARSTQPGDWVLLKGSRGMALERVLDHLRALLEGTSAPASTEH
jgi:UDP-N-acetylmuramoyl-tripeptide--D-alanyl-D-alanine ligase